MNVMMMQTISIAAYLMAGISAIAAVILWFRLNIREVLEDLSGKKVKRQILKRNEKNLDSDSATAILQEEYRLILNEIIVHTEERIRK